MNLKNIGTSALAIHFLIFLFGIMILFSPDSTISAGVSVGGYTFNVTGAIVTIVISIAVVLVALALVGIQGLASGINDTGTFQIIKIVTLASVWGILSSVSFQYLSFLGFFGIMIYSILTLMFAIYMIISSGDSE